MSKLAGLDSLRRTTFPVLCLRVLLVALLTFVPAIPALVVTSTPARADVDPKACLALVKDTVKGGLNAAKDAAEIAGLAARAAACVSAASSDPVQAVVIGMMLILAGAGEFSDSSSCEAAVNSAVGVLIAEAFQKAGIDKVLDEIKPGTSDYIASLVGGTATEAITDAIPPLAAWVTCGCAVAGVAGDEAALAKDIVKQAEKVADDAKQCSPEAAWVIDKFDKAVDWFEDGASKVAEFIQDEWCKTDLAKSVDGHCKPPPQPTSCVDGAMIAGDAVQVSSGIFYSKATNEVCSCTGDHVWTATVSSSNVPQFTCMCPVSGQRTNPDGSCGCPGDQQVISLAGRTPFCGGCPDGSTTDNGVCSMCPVGSITNVNTGVPADSPFAVDHDQVCKTCGPRSISDPTGNSCDLCASTEYKDPTTNTCQRCDPSKGDYLDSSGLGCFNISSCGPNQTVTPVNFGYSAETALTYYQCTCADGLVSYGGTCVQEILCNAGQHADYGAGRCVNDIDCKGEQVVKVTTALPPGDPSGQSTTTTYECKPCATGTYNPWDNTCQPGMLFTAVCGDNQVNDPKDSSQCITCKPGTHKSGGVCLVGEVAYPKQPQPSPGTLLSAPGPGVLNNPLPTPPCPGGQLRADGTCLTGDVARPIHCPSGTQQVGRYCMTIFGSKPDTPIKTNLPAGAADLPKTTGPLTGIEGAVKGPDNPDDSAKRPAPPKGPVTGTEILVKPNDSTERRKGSTNRQTQKKKGGVTGTELLVKPNDDADQKGKSKGTAKANAGTQAPAKGLNSGVSGNKALFKSNDDTKTNIQGSKQQSGGSSGSSKSPTTTKSASPQVNSPPAALKPLPPPPPSMGAPRR